MVSSEGYTYLDLDVQTKNWVFEQMRSLAEDWIGNKFRLVGSAVYGLRKYKRGANLSGETKNLINELINQVFLEWLNCCPKTLCLFSYNKSMKMYIKKFLFS